MSEKPLVWVGSSLDDARSLPNGARRIVGYQLRRVQLGLMPDDWKPMPTIGPGINEIRIHSGTEHRVIYVARFAEAVYVLHVFEKKTRATPQRDIEITKKRLAFVMRQRKE